MEQHLEQHLTIAASQVAAVLWLCDNLPLILLERSKKFQQQSLC